MNSIVDAQSFKLGPGVNISHWLSQRAEGMPDPREFFTPEDVAFIKKQGFRHIRLPIEESIMWKRNGERDETAFATLKDALDWIQEAGLTAIVDLHIINSHHFNASNNEGENTLFTSPQSQQHLVDLWMDLSRFLRSYDNGFLAYELLNEAVAEDSEDWNALVAKLIQAVRQVEPHRNIVVGSNRWQMVQTFPELEVPPEDSHIILSFHYYSPFPFTHYKASWVGPYRTYEGPIQYPGALVPEGTLEGLPAGPVKEMLVDNYGPHSKETLQESMQVAFAKAEKLGMPIYCGEWGCLPTVPREDRLAWYRDMSRIFREEEVAHAIWDYKGSFGIRNHETGEADKALIEAILSPQ